MPQSAYQRQARLRHTAGAGSGIMRHHAHAHTVESVRIQPDARCCSVFCLRHYVTASAGSAVGPAELPMWTSHLCTGPIHGTRVGRSLNIRVVGGRQAPATHRFQRRRQQRRVLRAPSSRVNVKAHNSEVQSYRNCCNTQTEKLTKASVASWVCQLELEHAFPDACTRLCPFPADDVPACIRSRRP